MPAFGRISIPGLIGAMALCAFSLNCRAEDWPPISQDELQMKSEPKAPGAPAIVLYRQVDRDDNGPIESVYIRLKILTDVGRKYADIEVPFDRSRESVYSIQARTVHPDGSIVKFDGQVYEKPIAQTQGVKWLAKTFTLPDVQVGSVVEYRYKHAYETGFVFNSRWTLSQDLFTKYAKFSLDPYRQIGLRYSWPVGLPDGTAAPKDERGKIRLETRDVPAFVTEEFMPPENELKFRVDFIYYSEWDPQPEKDPDVFWKKYGKKKYGLIEDFVGKRRAMADAVAQIVAPGDTPEVKLHKIYDRTLQLRNLSFERRKSEQEVNREKLKSIKNVEDVWRLGYGGGNDITWLFLALARAAGVQADPVVVATREDHFFNRSVMNTAELNSNVVVVTLDGKDVYLDPGTALAPFGLLPWNETAVVGVRLNKEGGTWIVIPSPEPGASRIDRKGTFKLTPSGTLEGKVTVTYTGQEALWRRIEERNEDDADRKQFLEDQIQFDVASGIVAELTNAPDWNSAASALVAEYDIKILGWAASAGQRLVMPLGVFGASEKRSFLHDVRTRPLYFSFRYETEDDLTIQLPPDWQLAGAPEPRADDRNSVAYSISGAVKSGALQLKRDFKMGMVLVDKKYYASIQDFYELVRAGDEQQIVLLPPKKSTVH